MPQPPPFPKINLRTPAGARAEVFQHGAHVASWVPADGYERLFLSRTSAFRAGAAIRGGVPICFPQFSGLGPLPKHGFARTLNWELIYQQETVAEFRLRDTEATRALWLHAFEVTYRVDLTDDRLGLTLTVANTGPQAFSFTGALHTYLRVPDVYALQIAGLEGLRYFDNLIGTQDNVQSEKLLSINQEIDRVYYNVPDQLTVHNSAYATTLRAGGFTDAVVWNPWIEKGAFLGDLEPDGYRRMVCVEAAVAGQPVQVQPGERWQGSQSLFP